MITFQGVDKSHKESKVKGKEVMEERCCFSDVPIAGFSEEGTVDLSRSGSRRGNPVNIWGQGDIPDRGTNKYNILSQEHALHVWRAARGLARRQVQRRRGAEARFTPGYIVWDQIVQGLLNHGKDVILVRWLRAWGREWHDLRSVLKRSSQLLCGEQIMFLSQLMAACLKALYEFFSLACKY